MSLKNIIKELIVKTDSDILFEKFVSFLPDDNGIIYEPKGLFNKGIRKDTGKVKRKGKYLFVELNRPGLYDVLPKGLFQNKLDDSNNKEICFRFSIL